MSEKSDDIKQLFSHLGLNPSDYQEIVAIFNGPHPETGEELFHSFAGVPIVRREASVGVLCVQHAEPRGYADIEIEALQTVAMVLSELIANAGLIDTAAGEPALLQQAQSLARRLSGPPDQLEAQARRLVQDLVLLAQAVLLRRQAPAAVAEAFIATRFDPGWGGVAGTLDVSGLDVEALLQRALPA